MLHEELPEPPFVKLCEGVVGDGKVYFREAVAQGYEGIVAKRLTSRYLPNRRGTAWRKIKQTMEVPSAVIGYRSGGSGLSEVFRVKEIHFLGEQTALRDGAFDGFWPAHHQKRENSWAECR
jgi:ATP-dependent DNA ligase